MIWIFLLIYFVSLVIHIIACYIINKRTICRIGDLIDLIEFYMYFPVVNTLGVLALIIVYLIIVMKLDVLWNKFRNIKLK